MNVIVVVCNSLHLGFLGAYGNAWIETPNLDRLAAEGVVFDHHFPENLTTLPTRRSWWTGRYGFADPEQGWTPLRPDEPILPDLLWDKGVQDRPDLRRPAAPRGRAGLRPRVRRRDLGPRAGLRPARARRRSPGPERPARRRAGPAAPARGRSRPRRSGRARWEQFLRNRAVLRTDVEENTGVARTVRTAIDWLDRRGSRVRPVPALARPVQPARAVGPAPALSRPVRHRRARRVRGRRGGRPGRGRARGRGDRHRGRPGPDRRPGRRGRRRARRGRAVPAAADLRRAPSPWSIAGSASCSTPCGRWAGWTTPWSIFTSDQGEPLGEHGFVRRFRPWLYEELIHTPLIIRMPGGKFGGSRHQALVQTVDLLPTILGGLRPAAGRSSADPRPRPAPPDPGRADQGPRLRLPRHGRRGVRHPDPPLAPDRADRAPTRTSRGPPSSIASRRTAGTRTTSSSSTPRSPSTSS